jgi:hypothetical protein
MKKPILGIISCKGTSSGNAPPVILSAVALIASDQFLDLNSLLIPVMFFQGLSIGFLILASK